MKREIWINKAKSFNDAQEFDTVYYLNLSSAQRVETVQVFREAYFQSNGLFRRENGKRLRRVLRVIKQDKADLELLLRDERQRLLTPATSFACP